MRPEIDKVGGIRGFASATALTRRDLVLKQSSAKLPIIMKLITREHSPETWKLVIAQGSREARLYTLPCTIGVMLLLGLSCDMLDKKEAV